MSPELAPAKTVRADRSPSTLVARETARRAVRGGALWGYIFGAYVAESAFGYASLYKTAAQRAAFAKTFGTNAGASALIGPAHALATVTGFTAWRSLGVLTIVGAVWGLLTGTRLLRGEEEAGRWELLLAGQTTRRWAAAQGVAGLGGGLGVLWAITAAITVVVGRSSRVGISVGAALFFALALVSGAAVFLAVGAFASQLAATRRQAAAYAGGVLGASYALRMVADSGAGLQSLRWASPLGWVEELQPLTAPHPLALAPIAGLLVLLVVLTVHLAGRRDLGASTLPDRASGGARTRLLSGPTGLSLRLLRASALGWGVAIAAGSLMLGLVAKAAGRAMTGSSITKLLERLGARGAGADEYLGVGFLIVAVLLALVAAGHVTAARGEEAEGRLDHLLARPVGRWSWLVGRLLVSVCVLVLFGAAAGVFAWLGAASQGAGVRFTSSIAAGLNVVPPGVLLLGLGVLTLGLWPRGVSAVTYAVLAWSFLVELVGGIVKVNHFLLDTSIFHHMAGAPAVSPDWASAATLLAIGLACAGLGGLAFARRDTAGA